MLLANEYQRSCGSLGDLTPYPGPTAIEHRGTEVGLGNLGVTQRAPVPMEAHEGLLDGVLCSLAAARHDHSEPQKRGVVPPKQHLDEFGASRRRIAPTGGTLLTHREHLLRNGVRHAQESFDYPLRLTQARPGLDQ